MFLLFYYSHTNTSLLILILYPRYFLSTIKIEDCFWESIAVSYMEYDLLKTMLGTNCMTWWHLSDMHPEYITMCEGVAKLVAHASKLNCDDRNFKELAVSNKVC